MPGQDRFVSVPPAEHARCMCIWHAAQMSMALTRTVLSRRPAATSWPQVAVTLSYGGQRGQDAPATSRCAGVTIICLSSFGFSLSSADFGLPFQNRRIQLSCLLALLLLGLPPRYHFLQCGTGPGTCGSCAHTVFAIITAPICTAELLHPPRHLTSHLCWHSNRLHTSPLDSSLDLSSRLSLLLFIISSTCRKLNSYSFCTS